MTCVLASLFSLVCCDYVDYLVKRLGSYSQHTVLNESLVLVLTPLDKVVLNRYASPQVLKEYTNA